MATTPDLFPRFCDVIRRLSNSQVEDAQSVPELRLASSAIGGRSVEMVYAPFDHVNRSARIVVVGLTPGRQQAANAIRAAQQALRDGATNAEAAERAKIFASFSGPMRSNLIAMLDKMGIAHWLGLQTAGTLWDDDSRLIHFTSALRYPVFVDGENWSGNPDVIRSADMRQWLETYTGTELAQLTNAVFVPLGPKVSAALNHLADIGQISRERILDGMPHPSGARAHRLLSGYKASCSPFDEDERSLYRCCASQYTQEGSPSLTEEGARATTGSERVSLRRKLPEPALLLPASNEKFQREERRRSGLFS